MCDRFGILVLEDDPYGKLRFEGEALPGLFEAEGLDRVIFTSSFSKTVAPGLRVGYLVAPPDLSARLAAAASRTYISPALLAEAAIHALIEGGHLPGNIARVTGLMRERRDAMVAGLRHMPEGTRCVPPAGGFFCWLTLPEGLSADDLFDDAAQAGISYVKGSDCVLEGGERTLRLAYSGVSPSEIEEGMERLGAVFRAALVEVAVSDPDKPPRGPDRDGIDEREVRRIAMAGGVVLVASIALVFIVENSHQVHVSFVFFSSDISLIWVIILSAAVGAVAGAFGGRAIRKRLGK